MTAFLVGVLIGTALIIWGETSQPLDHWQY